MENGQTSLALRAISPNLGEKVNNKGQNRQNEQKGNEKIKLCAEGAPKFSIFHLSVDVRRWTLDKKRKERDECKEYKKTPSAAATGRFVHLVAVLSSVNQPHQEAKERRDFFAEQESGPAAATGRFVIFGQWHYLTFGSIKKAKSGMNARNTRKLPPQFA